MPTTTFGARDCVPLAVFAVLAFSVGSAPAQASFRVTHSVNRTTATHVEVTGTVVNESRADAGDVSVTVEALGPSGKVLARGVTYVTSRLPDSGTATFTAKVPAAPGVVSYRAMVTSYRFMQPVQGP